MLENSASADPSIFVDNAGLVCIQDGQQGWFQEFLGDGDATTERMRRHLREHGLDLPDGVLDLVIRGVACTANLDAMLAMELQPALFFPKRVILLRRDGVRVLSYGLALHSRDPRHTGDAANVMTTFQSPNLLTADPVNWPVTMTMQQVHPG